MNKRPHPDESSSHSGGKHKHVKLKHQESEHGDSALNFADQAVAQLPPQVSQLGEVPAYVPFSVSTALPDLPPVTQPRLSTAPFIHRSTINANRSSLTSSSCSETTYEHLEFLGDAYIELFATRLIYSRYPHLPAGHQSQLREQLVKNETLSNYSRLYGFDKRVDAANLTRMQDDARHKGNKGFNKILGDVFEAYVAAVIESDAEHGFAVAEKWLTALWAPKLLDVSTTEKSSAAARSVTGDAGRDPAEKTYDPEAKNTLQKRIYAGQDTRLEYEKYKDSVELKGARLGQTRHFIALYLTGWGYERKLLGKGEGRNKVEAGNWAAIEAMNGDCKAVVDECEEKLKVRRVEREAKRESEARESGS